MDTYNDVCQRVSRTITNSYSTSFSLGIRLFSPRYRKGIYAIYGFVRLADEIVDTFLDYDRKNLLEGLRNEICYALEHGISINPVINSFQSAVRQYSIDKELIDAFLNSMEMDLYNSSYERKNYNHYVFGSAEVVGLMCLKVFCEKNHEMFDRLKESARMLGAAFQKVNFLRDLESDITERNRIYLPNVSNEVYIDNISKNLLEQEIEKEFKQAYWGILHLPKGVRLGVYSAYITYYSLFKKIQALDVTELRKTRVRIPNQIKLLLVLRSIWELKMNKHILPK